MIRAEKPDWAVNFAFKDDRRRVKDKVVEEEFKAFRDNLSSKGLSVKDIMVPKIAPTPKVVTNEVSKMSGDVNTDSMAGDNIERMVGKLVYFLRFVEDVCETCSSMPNIDHLHFILSEGMVIDPKNDIPDFEEVSCSCCGSTSDLKKCKKCGLVYYCSRKCQMKDWTARHHSVCSTSSPSPSGSLVGSLSFNASTSFASLPIQSPQTVTPSIQSPNGCLEEIKGPLVKESKTAVDQRLEGALNKLEKMVISSPVVPTRAVQVEIKASTPKTVETVKPVVKPAAAVVVEEKKEEEPRRKLDLGKKYEFLVVWQEGAYYFISDETATSEVMIPAMEMILKKEASITTIAASVGVFCAAKSVDDGQYYRAKVTEIVDDNQVEVLFIDYGNKNIIDKKYLKALPESLDPKGVHPPYAVKVKGKDAEVDEKLAKSYNDFVAVSITPYSEVTPGVYVVQ